MQRYTYHRLCFLFLFSLAACSQSNTLQKSATGVSDYQGDRTTQSAVVTDDLRPPHRKESPFRPIEDRPPSLYRNASGAPTNAYWQQEVVYIIDAELDTLRHRIKGKSKMTYINRSPDKLNFLWLQLDQNQLRANGRVKKAIPEPENEEGLFSRKEFMFDGGMTLHRVSLSPARSTAPPPGKDKRKGPKASPTFYTPELQDNDTVLRLTLKDTLSPNMAVEIEMEWDYPIQLTGRTGREETEHGWVYQIAQWYPRFCVYDDLNGWNTLQYLGAGEFYTEFASFEVTLRVPSTHLVAATGTLQNPETALSPLIRERLKTAWQSEKTVMIVGQEERGKKVIRPQSAPMTEWRFKADRVRDFAWASSAAFLWDAAAVDIGEGKEKKTVLAQSLYPKEALPLWGESTQMVRESLKQLSQWHPYPYETMINVNGAVPSGMEYPMMIFCRERANPFFLYVLTLHEVGHSWFPMMVQNDERRYAWLDEGLNSFMEYEGLNARFGGSGFGMVSARALVPYMKSERHQALMTRPDEILDLGANAYDKAALALISLREVVLGKARFDDAFKHFISRWKFKRPHPTDFFRTIENVAGEDLAWFWRGWFYTPATLDQAIGAVNQKDSLGKSFVSIELLNYGEMVMPIHLECLLVDSTKKEVTLPVEIWLKENRFVTGFFTELPVIDLQLDPLRRLPDTNPNNNIRSLRPQRNTAK